MKIDVPIISSTIAIGEILSWVKRSTQTIHYGKVGMNFIVQDDLIVGYEPVFLPHIKPHQVIVDALPHSDLEESYSVIAEAVENGEAVPGETPRYEPPDRGN